MLRDDKQIAHCAMYAWQETRNNKVHMRTDPQFTKINNMDPDADELNKTLQRNSEQEQETVSSVASMKKMSVSNDIETIADSIVQPDGGWGWVVCFCCMLCNGVVFGTLNSFGILYVAIRDEYDSEGSNISFEAAWVGSMCIGLTFLLSFVAGVVSDSIGIRKTAVIGALVSLVGILGSAFVEDLRLLYLTFGLIMGLGFSFTISQSFVILGHYFKRNLGIASGLQTMGGSLFTIGLSHGLPHILESIGLQKTLLTMVGLIAVLVPCALTWKAVFPTRSSRLLHSAKGNLVEPRSPISKSRNYCFCMGDVINMAVCKDKNYALWAVSFSMAMMGYFILFVHLVKHSNDVFPAEDGSLLIMCISATGGVSRILIGKLADFHWVSRKHLVLVCWACFGLGILCIPFLPNFDSLITMSVALGVFDGAVISGINPVIFDLVGHVNMSQALGFLFAVIGLTSTAGPPLAGLLYDIYGTYNLAFYSAGGVCMLAAFMMLFVKTPKTIPAHERQESA